MKYFILFLFIFSLTFKVKAQQSAISPDSLKKIYLKEQASLRDSFNSYFYPKFKKWIALPENLFIKLVDSGRAVSAEKLKSFADKFDPAFLHTQQESNRFYFDQLLAYYPDIHPIYSDDRSPSVSMVTERLNKNIPDFNRPELLGLSEFTDYGRSFLDSRIRKEMARSMYKTKDNQWMDAAWNLISAFIQNDSCRDYWKYTYLSDHIDNSGIENISAHYSGFITTCKDTAFVHKILQMYSDDSAGRTGHLIRTYKTIGNVKLNLHIFLPDKTHFAGPRPVFVFFHGGSWTDGKPDWFFYPCRDYAKKGWVACAAEYRVFNRNGTTPFESVKDGRSAIRWLRKHAGEYAIDTSRIVASGNSSGGHLVLTSALADLYNDSTDDLSYSPVPNILLVNSGVFDLTPPSWYNPYGKDSLHVRQISPTLLVRKGMPPTLIIHGTEDSNVPFITVLAFDSAMKRAGNENYAFHPIAGATHFIWYDPRYWPQVEQVRSEFLKKYGY